MVIVWGNVDGWIMNKGEGGGEPKKSIGDTRKRPRDGRGPNSQGYPSGGGPGREGGELGKAMGVVSCNDVVQAG